MKRFNVYGAALIAALLVGFLSSAQAYPRAAGGRATTVTEDEGDRMTPYNVSVGTTTAVKVYDKGQSFIDRKLRVCNDQDDTYRLLLSTSANVTGTATQSTEAHDMVLPNSCNEYNAFPQDIYAVFRASATTGSFTGGRAFGWKRYDSRD